MRHRKSFNHLGRTSSHRKAMLSNMATSLIMHKRITTTVAKAKELRSYVEPLITRSKDDTTHSRRTVFSLLQDKAAVAELFREVAAKVGERPGGYTRVIKLGKRLGDNADMAMMELVDFNELLLSEKSGVKAKATRRRRGSKTATITTAPVAEKKAEAPKPEAPAEEEKSE
jgi:large subunit ribosomal protein L17